MIDRRKILAMVLTMAVLTVIPGPVDAEDKSSDSMMVEMDIFVDLEGLEPTEGEGQGPLFGGGEEP